MVRPLRLAVLFLLLSSTACDWMKERELKSQKSEAEVRREQQARLRRACASPLTYDRLKELAFDEATRIRNRDPRDLDGLATASVVRMEEPVVKSRDESLNVTVCQGRFILELPPGAENAFDGQRRLTADIEYAAQEAVDGSGLVFHMEGAEPIVYRLATIGGLSAGPPLRPAGARIEPPVSVPPPAAPMAPTPPHPEWQPQRKAARAAPARTAASPSFNCNHARTASERRVCGSGGLAALDRQMSSQFYSALARAEPGTRRQLRTGRDRFLRDRERCGSDACVAQAYRERMAEIARISGR